MALLEAADEAAAQRLLDELGCTDGLPVVIPTPERVERMVLTSGLDPQHVLGVVPPRNGVATVESVAANAVMAGCDPEHFPVVVAAVQAALDPDLDLAELQATTNPVSPLLIVNGPVRLQCGIASGYGALGPGHRGNATVGRALRLVLLSLGGAIPGVGDMALLGHGSKFSACLAEAEEESPFDPLHVSRGWDADDSTVTVVGSDAPQAVVFERIPDHAVGSELLIDLLAATLGAPAHVGSYSGDGSDVVILNPAHAQMLSEAGWDRERLLRSISERSATPVGQLRRMNPAVYGAVALRHRDWSDDTVLPASLPDRLLLMVAGGRGAYSWVLRSWGVGAHRGSPVTKRVEIDQACEVFLGPA